MTGAGHRPLVADVGEHEIERMKRLEQKQARRWRRRWPWNTRAYRWLYKHVIEPNATW